MPRERSPPLGRRWEGEMERQRRISGSSGGERQGELYETRREMRARYPVSDSTQWHGSYPPVTSMGEQGEIPELDNNPHAGLGHSSAAPPRPPPSAGIAGLRTREEQPPTSNPAVPTNYPRVVPPEAPPSDATAAELKSHILRLQNDLRDADVRIQDLEARQSGFERAQMQAVYSGQEREIPRLKMQIDTLKGLLDQAYHDKDRLQHALQESRAREAALEEQLHRANMEGTRAAAEAEGLRMGASMSHAPRGRSPPEEEVEAARPRAGGRSCGNRRNRIAGWDLPKGKISRMILP